MAPKVSERLQRLKLFLSLFLVAHRRTPVGAAVPGGDGDVLPPGTAAPTEKEKALAETRSASAIIFETNEQRTP